MEFNEKNIVLLLIIIIGLIISKEFRRGIVTSLGSALVFSPVIVIGLVYALPYSIFMAFKEKSIKIFFKIWWRLIDGTYAFIGDVLYEGFAERYDELGNVWGEWIEDLSTHTENTTFGDKRTTISASIGFLEYSKLHMSKGIKLTSKILNVAFNQARHALGSYLEKLRLQELKTENLHGNRFNT